MKLEPLTKEKREKLYSMCHDDKEKALLDVVFRMQDSAYLWALEEIKKPLKEYEKAMRNAWDKKDMVHYNKSCERVNSMLWFKETLKKAFEVVADAN